MEEKRIVSQKVTAAKAEPKYPVSKLRETCYAVLGVTQSTFDGAFAGKSPTDLYTIQEAKQIIDTWGAKPFPELKREV